MRRLRGLIFTGGGIGFILMGLVAPLTSGNPIFLLAVVMGAALVAIGVQQFVSGTRRR